MNEKKQKHKSPEEVKAELQAQKDMEDNKACAEKIEAVLKEYGRAIQNYLQYSEAGIMPRSRLVKHVAEEEPSNDESENESGEGS